MKMTVKETPKKKTKNDTTQSLIDPCLGVA